MKKALGLILLAMMAVTSLISCGNSAVNTTAADSGNANTALIEETAETEAMDILEYLPKEDYEGYEFRMLVRNFERWIKDMYIETEVGDIVDDAVYKRNARVSDEYNIVFKCTPSSNDNYETDALNSIIAGDDAYDLIIPHPRASFTYANQKLFLDWNKDLEYVDLDNPWWDQDARENLSINNKLYVMVGDISYQCLGACNVMLFNKSLFNDYGIKYPYEEAANGTWTFDKFEKIVRDSYRDINGDGQMIPEDDQYGYVTQYWVGPIQALYVAGQRVLRKDDNDLPYISLYNDTTLKVFDWYYGIVDDECAYVQTTGNSWAGGFISVFSEGRSMFIDVNMCDVITMRTMEADFGIIPWPKLDENAEYCTNVDAGTNMFGVPITEPDTSRTSLILEALSCIGYNEVVPAYYSVALQTKFSRDVDSADMLDIIKKSRVFDLGYYNNALTGELGNQFAAFAAKTDRDFTSWYVKNEKAALANIDKITAVYLED